MKLSTAFHPDRDGQAEQIFQTLEDMLRACVIDFSCNMDDHLRLIELSYNNSYHSPISMDPSRHIMGEGVDLYLGGMR